jgi:hypothetical protein
MGVQVDALQLSLADPMKVRKLLHQMTLARVSAIARNLMTKLGMPVSVKI